MEIHSPIRPPHILLPKAGIDLNSFSVIACDQFTSQCAYWDELKEKIGEKPSTFHMIFPEAYLSKVDEKKYIEDINANINYYLKQDVLRDIGECFILVERMTPHTKRRLGLVISVDLEAYSYQKGTKALIRATEATIVERIPPRLKVRENAPIELTHVQFLFDDPKKTIIEKLYAKRDSFPIAYDFDLNQNGGHLRGYIITDTKPIIEAFNQLTLKNGNGLMFVVGDGNHSLATAKAHWDNVKAKLTDVEKENHPARFALVEAINLYDQGLDFEPIHRVVFNITPDFVPGLRQATSGTYESHVYCKPKGQAALMIPENAPLAYRQIQDYVDSYVKAHPGASVDYVHDIKSAHDVADKHPEAVVIAMPALTKADLFAYIAKGDVLPRKTFSMGHAVEKRYYLECKRIK
ncbi:MAG: DUF1015 domain-containing protein [Bacteroidia bacterium]|nr:DUF1015 domain-containing protein [Bacteroidia bacterium]